MGADGGVVITKVSQVKLSWLSLKKDLIKAFESKINKEPKDWEVNDFKECLELINKLPDRVTEYSEEEIVKLLKTIFESCDTPYLVDGLMLTGYGDNVSGRMYYLSWVLRQTCDGIYIETWT